MRHGRNCNAAPKARAACLRSGWKLQQLAIACAQAGLGQRQPVELEPNAESALAQLGQMPSPLPELAAFMRRLALAEIPALPSNLPEELRPFFTQLLEAAKEAMH